MLSTYVPAIEKTRSSKVIQLCVKVCLCLCIGKQGVCYMIFIQSIGAVQNKDDDLYLN